MKEDGARAPLPVKALGIAWLLTLLGLLTGMLWAQLAWGRYWGWDPKETTTLILFALLSIHLAVENSDGALARLKGHGKAMHLAEAAMMLAVLVSPTLAASLH